ncbi:MAG: hypothetical protein LBL90_12550 [Prevotellaceae bacterium]|jgi:hypothetical protein|nr:hypothetical protein [Prevotellaceae bacterium]
MSIFPVESEISPCNAVSTALPKIAMISPKLPIFASSPNLHRRTVYGREYQ